MEPYRKDFYVIFTSEINNGRDDVSIERLPKNQKNVLREKNFIQWDYKLLSFQIVYTDFHGRNLDRIDLQDLQDLWVGNSQIRNFILRNF